MGPLSLDLRTGEILFLAGASGSGKTRLLRALADLDPVREGDIRLDSRPSTELTPWRYRLRVGYLPARPDLGAGTLQSLMGRIRSLAFRGNAGPCGEDLDPLGLSRDLLTRPVSALSTGETVRVGLSLLLSGEPEVLLLDEPTSALDPVSRERVEDLLRHRAQQGMAILWVSHDPAQAARLADGLMWLDDTGLQGPERRSERFAERIRTGEPARWGDSGDDR